MTKRFIMVGFLWGFILWLIGYLLGIVLFAVVPHSMIGWIIMLVGVVITLWVLLKKIAADTLQCYFFIAIAWVLIAVVCDYFLLVKVFKPADGYYKPDVYLYYALTFVLPLLVGWLKSSKKRHI